MVLEASAQVQGSISQQDEFDICIIGQTTLDKILIHGQNDVRPGGVPYYAHSICAGLGHRVCVVTRHGREAVLNDGSVWDPGVTAFVDLCDNSIVFLNSYNLTASGSDRSQLVSNAKGAIRESQLPKVSAKLWLVGPLLPDDLDLQLYSTIRARGGQIAVDLQGHTRAIVEGQVVPHRGQLVNNILASADIVKCSKEEATVITSEEDPTAAIEVLLQNGPSEVLITDGAQGSFVGSRAGIIHSKAPKTGAIIDPTGCGDTYFAAYLSRRLSGEHASVAIEFASCCAAMKLARRGPVPGSDVRTQRRPDLVKL